MGSVWHPEATKTGFHREMLAFPWASLEASFSQDPRTAFHAEPPITSDGLMAWKAGDLKSSLLSGLGGRKGPFKQMRNPSVCHFSLKLSGGVLVASGVDVFSFSFFYHVATPSMGFLLRMLCPWLLRAAQVFSGAILIRDRQGLD